jgi:hypothetical protein
MEMLEAKLAEVLGAVKCAKSIQIIIEWLLIRNAERLLPPINLSPGMRCQI